MKRPDASNQPAESAGERPRKRIELPWTARLGTGSIATLNSDGTFMTKGPIAFGCTERTQAVAELARKLGECFHAGSLDRVELEVRGKMRCIIDCKGRDEVIVSLATLDHQRARIPVAPIEAFRFHDAA